MDGAIHPDNARLMLEKLFGNQDFEEAYFNGLMGCSDSVQEMISNRRSRPQRKQNNALHSHFSMEFVPRDMSSTIVHHPAGPALNLAKWPDCRT